MADILCPVCGKANPEELEICQYCGSLLKNRGTEPLAPIRPGEAPTPKKTAELERTLPAWLRDIRKGDTGKTDEAAGTQNTQSPISTLGAPEAQKREPSKKNESPLDLLAGLAQSGEEEEQIPDWLANLKSNIPGGPVPSPEPPAGASQPADIPVEQPQQPADWLSSLQNDAPTLQPAREQPAIDWGFTSEPVPSDDTEKPAAEITGETPDWLTALKAQEQNTPDPGQPAPTASFAQDDMPSAGNLPDWLNNLGNETASQAASAPESPSLEAHTYGPANETPLAPSEPEPAGNLPDWLAGLESNTSSSSAMQPTSAFESPAENIPALSTESSPPSGDLPDWLATAIGEKSSETPPPDLNQSKAFNTGALEELNSPGGTSSLPDWMAGLDAGPAAASGSISSEPEQQAAPAQNQPALTTPPLSPQAATGSDTFDWLTKTADAQSKPIETESKPVETAASLPVEKPETASAPEVASPASVSPFGNDQNMDAILSMDMPDWLAGFAPTESEPPKTSGGQASGAPSGEDISPASLPSWVQAMRPMESVISGAQGGDEDQSVEKEGPLAGLRSVLPGHTGALGPHKPKAYSIKLQVDSTQQAQAALLENLIASEAESRPVSLPRQVMNIRPLRWAIAVVLLLMILVPVLIGPTGLFPVPPVEPNGEIQLFQQKINDLPANALVLVVFDYQPGYAGEMEQIVGPVISNLVQKKARMVFVSTSPMGTLMSERVMAPYTDYKLNEQYINLGYLPGDTAGIQVFARDPHTLGNDYRRPESLWTVVDPDPKKKKINTVGDFEATLVLTENSDTARTWIEQTSQVRSADKPMLMVLSAQAEPMIRPYYISGQIQGMLSGLAGATAYQQANPNWDSYAAGMMSAELLIIFGGIWALVENLRTRRAAQREDDGEDEA